MTNVKEKLEEALKSHEFYKEEALDGFNNDVSFKYAQEQFNIYEAALKAVLASMPDEGKLLPCPFCGGDAQVKAMEDGGLAVFCMDKEYPDFRNKKCIAMGDTSYGHYRIGEGRNEGEFENKEQATAAWNARAIHKHLEEEMGE